tara:strand:+ start:2393 stop:2836 length:444 start_codon:yes stop_codon:yes gene_type:complete
MGKIINQVGETSVNVQHSHEYKVDVNGNGWAFDAVHPKAPDIRHSHRVLNWIVQPAKSACFPYCKNKYGYNGSPPHIHAIEDSPNLSDIDKNILFKEGSIPKNKNKITKTLKFKGAKIPKKVKNNKRTNWIPPKKYHRGTNMKFGNR